LLVSARPGIRVLGFGLHTYGFVLDCVDGQLARSTGTTSRFGMVLDELTDRGGEMYLIHRLGDAVSRPVLVPVAVGLQLSRHLLARLLRSRKAKRPAQRGSDRPSVGEHARSASNLTIGDRLGIVTAVTAAAPSLGLPAYASLGGAGLLRDVVSRRINGLEPIRGREIVACVVGASGAAVTVGSRGRAPLCAMGPYIFLALRRWKSTPSGKDVKR